MNIDASIRRWERRSVAEARTPWVLEGPLERGRRVLPHRMGSLEVFDWTASDADGPHVHLGGVAWTAERACERLRVPSEKDAAALDALRERMATLHREEDALARAAYQRGRKPTLEEIRTANFQVRLEAGD